jgi:hypothetical protein
MIQSAEFEKAGMGTQTSRSTGEVLSLEYGRRRLLVRYGTAFQYMESSVNGRVTVTMTMTMPSRYIGDQGQQKRHKLRGPHGCNNCF